ncbi:unnamed protein product [Oikopleura dioica]|uniref:Uncharacterized protein n=1 Tax=Oikopleura dioica TaxID=34765 RepID=E4Y8E9_OIKDI|nr:unnamed protein product [Oikopleura dioica]
MRLAYLEKPETWKRAAQLLQKLDKNVQMFLEKSNKRFSKGRKLYPFPCCPKRFQYIKLPKKEITLQTIIEDIDEIIHVGKLIKATMKDLLEVFSPPPKYEDFLELLSQNSEFDINANVYRPDSLLLTILHNILNLGVGCLPEIFIANGIHSGGIAPYLSLYIFFKAPCDSFMLELDVGIDYLTKLKGSIRARCRAHLSRQLEPVQITRVLGVKLADMIIKKSWSGVGRSPPDFFWHDGQDPGLAWAKRGLTQERD